MGYSSFAECQGHSAKAQKHSATALPSVTLGKEHMASFCRQTAVCRVFFVGHSAKPLPSAGKTLGKIKMRKKPKNNSKIFQKKKFGGGRHQPAPARLHRSRCIFCAKFAANAAGGIQTHDLSLTCLLLYHCTTLSLVSRFRYLSLYIILNRE